MEKYFRVNVSYSVGQQLCFTIKNYQRQWRISGCLPPRLSVHFHAFLRRNWFASPRYGCHLPATWIRHWLIAVREHRGPSKVSLAPSILTKNTGITFLENADIKDRLYDKCIFVDCISFKGCLSCKLAFPGWYNKSIETILITTSGLGTVCVLSTYIQTCKYASHLSFSLIDFVLVWFVLFHFWHATSSKFKSVASMSDHQIERY